jgi:hypothetical protein
LKGITMKKPRTVELTLEIPDDRTDVSLSAQKKDSAIIHNNAERLFIATSETLEVWWLLAITEDNAAGAAKDLEDRLNSLRLGNALGPYHFTVKGSVRKCPKN